MAPPIREVLVVSSRLCPNCFSRDWWVGILASAVDGGGWVDLRPTRMARCAGCRLSADLAGDEIAWEP